MKQTFRKSLERQTRRCGRDVRTCELSKHEHVFSFNTIKDKKPHGPFYLMYTDVIFYSVYTDVIFFDVESIGDNLYAILFVDDTTRWRQVY